MPLAILADIHANALALEAVLEHAQKQNTTEFIDLGDVLYGPLEPHRTYDLLQTITLVSKVRGNQDRLITQGPGPNPTLDFVRQDLGQIPIDYLKTLPRTAEYDNLLLCHGTPTSDTTYLLEEIQNGRPQVREDKEIEGLLQGTTHKVILCGHTHIPRLVQLQNGTLILNPGSVGLPAYDDDAPVPHFMETFSPHASYATFEQTAHGWAASFHRVPYDHKKAAAQARALNRPDWAQGIEFGRMS